MGMTSESDETMPNNGVDSPSVDDANTEGFTGGNGSLKKGPWTSVEDAILVEYVTKHGEGNWNAVQKQSGLARCGKSCRLRWANHLRPNLKKEAFSPEEERLIIELHAKMGNKWARMAGELPGRTDNEIKNFWNTRIKRRQRAGLPIYPPEISPHSLNENQQSENMNNFSGDVHHHQDFMPMNNFEIPAVEFKHLELNHDIFAPALHDFPGGNLLDVPACSLLAQGINSSYQNKSFLPTVHPSKRLRGSESTFPGISAPMCNAFTDGSQYQSDSPMQIAKSSSLFSGYNHNSATEASSSLHSGSEPTWAMKLELPSLQNQMGGLGSPSPSSPLPFCESVDILIQSPPNEHMQSSNPSSQNSGLLDAVLYESETMKNSKANATSQTNSSAYVVNETEWEAFNEQLSPLGNSSSPLLSESTPITGTSLDEPYYLGTLPAKEASKCDDKVETNDPMMFPRPDFLLKCWPYKTP